MCLFAVTAREYISSRGSQVAPVCGLFWRPGQSIAIALLSLKLFQIATGWGGRAFPIQIISTLLFPLEI